MSNGTQGRASFWTSLAGVVTAVAGLLSALVAAAALIFQILDKDDPPTTAPQPQPSATTAGPTAGPTRAADPGQPLWHDTLLFGNSGIDFDTTPPTRKPETGMDIYDGDSFQLMAYNSSNSVARWTGPDVPTARDCSDLLDRQGVDKVKFAQGQVFCVRTGGGRIAVVTFLDTAQGGESEIDAAVWPDPAA